MIRIAYLTALETSLGGLVGEASTETEVLAAVDDAYQRRPGRYLFQVGDHVLVAIDVKTSRVVAQQHVPSDQGDALVQFVWDVLEALKEK